jgi:hypothetical protein
MRTAYLAFSFASSLLLLACGDNLTTPQHEDYDAGSGGTAPLSCVPNLDGHIDPDELEAALGVPASYIVSPNGKERPVNLEGDVQGGARTWDFSATDPGDGRVDLIATELTGKWYAASFPGGQFVTPIDVGGSVEGVYAHSDTALVLLGVASAAEAPAEGQTLLVYDTPIELYRFPIQEGASWISTGEVTGGTVRGLPYAGKDTYEVEVFAVGKLVLPAYTFEQTFQVRTKVTLQPSVGASVVTRQAGFLFECFGEVARATSKNDEPEASFTTATELRRLGL